MPRASAVLVALSLTALVAAPAAAVHWYRNNGDTCSEVNTSAGPMNLGDAPLPGGASVLMLHTTFHDTTTGSPVTVVQAGQSVTWRWASVHCHSVTEGPQGNQGTADWQSGMRWPSQTSPPQVLPGFFEYPVPSLEPRLSYTHVFEEPGTYLYSCHHHWLIGMVGVVVVV